jgi:hypothetical protein
MKKQTLIVALLLIAAGFRPAAAQTGENPANWCRNGLFPQADAAFRIARLKGARNEKIHFRGDDRPDCPAARRCLLKSYLVPGDEVIVSRTYGNFACVWYQPVKTAETVGWIAADKIEEVAEKQAFAREDWLGSWKFYDNSLEIAAGEAETLKITGTALWKGLNGNVHVGELDNEARPAGNTLALGEADDEDGCLVKLRLVGRFLIASDNLRCGGANVTFAGVYRKK